MGAGTVTVKQMLALEADAISDGWTEEHLLDAAGVSLGRAIGRFFPICGMAVAYLGKGHNAGDALVALRVLRDSFGWQIGIRGAYPMEKVAPLVTRKWEELGSVPVLADQPEWPVDRGPLVLIDGLLGTGASGPLREPLAALADEMKRLRNQSGARIVAVDSPSGIDPDTGEIFPGTVTADATFMIGSAKTGLLMGAAANHTGALALVSVPVLASSTESDAEMISPQTQTFGKVPRPFDFHKGSAGRVAILAGSENYTGAAVLAATGALRGGAGLVTLYVPAAITGIVSSKCPVEVVVRGIGNPRELLGLRFDALVAGCGMGDPGEEWAQGLLELIMGSPAPGVIDADALNWIAKLEKSGILTERHVITPHPGEFKRLAADLAGLPREEAARKFASRVPAVLLLKGSRTIVTVADAPLRINSTGSPGMASGGQGDLLAGVIGALLARGEIPLDAASLGAWVCGRAAEVALNEPEISVESLLASDTARFLGAAFSDWKSRLR